MVNVPVASWIIGIYTMLQSAVMMVGNILLVLEHQDEHFDIFNSSYGYITDEGSYLCNLTDASVIIDPDVFYVVQLDYIALHCLWIVACIVILFQICSNARSYKYYVLWCIAAVIIFLFDMGVGITVAIDYGNFKDVEDCLGIGLMVFSFRGFAPIILNLLALVMVGMIMKDLKRGTVASFSLPTENARKW